MSLIDGHDTLACLDPRTKRKRYIESDDYGRLETVSTTPNTFGEQMIINAFPIIQSSAQYGLINPQVYDQFTTTGGSITADLTGITLSIDTTLYTYAVIRSTRPIKYRPGQDVVVRLTATFASLIPYFFQFVGVGNLASDAYVCCNPLLATPTFAVRVSTGGKADIFTLTMTAAATGVGTCTLTLPSASGTITVSVPVTNAGGTTAFTAHEVEKACLLNATFVAAYYVEHITNDLVFSRKAAGVSTGTFTFTGAASAAGTIVRTATGSALTSVYVNQTDFNGSYDRSALDITAKNMYQIIYSRGNNSFSFQVYNNNTRRFENMHTMTDGTLSCPTMFVQRGLYSYGSTTAKSILVGTSYAAYLGNPINTLVKNSVSSSKTSVTANTNNIILALQNRYTINAGVNQGELLITSLSIYVDGTKPCILSLVKNPDTTGNDTTSDFNSFVYVDSTYSLAKYDVTSKTYTGGSVRAQFALPKSGSQFFDLRDFDYYLNRDDLYLFVVRSTATTDVTLSVTFNEDF